MKIQSIILLFGIFCWQQLTAQLHPKLIVGEEIDIANKVQFQGFFGETPQAIYSVESKFTGNKIKDIFVGKYDKASLTKIFAHSILPPVDQYFSYEPLEIFMIGDAIFFCCKGIDEATKQEFIAFFEISKEGKRGKQINLGNLYTYTNQKQFFIAVNETENRFLLCRSLEPDISKKQKIELSAYNPKLEITWRDTLIFPYSNKVFSFLDFQYDGKDKVVFLAKKAGGIESKNEVILPIDNNKYSLFCYNHQQSNIKEIEIKIDNKHIQSIQYKFNENGVFVGGYFSNHDAKNMKGVYALVIDQNFVLKNASVHPFKTEEILPFYSNKIKTTPTVIDDLILKKMLCFPNGNFALLGEQFYIQTQTNYTTPMTGSSYENVYNYNNILVSFFDENGELLKNDCIHKYQSTYNDKGFYSSFFAESMGYKLFLLYNDAKQNSKLQNDDYLDYKPMKNYNLSCLYITEINAQGEIHKSILLKKDNKMFVPQLSSKMTGNIFYLFSQSRFKSNIMRLSF